MVLNTVALLSMYTVHIHIHLTDLTSRRLGWFILGIKDGARGSRVVVWRRPRGPGVHIGAGSRSSWVGRGWGSGSQWNTDDSSTRWEVLQRHCLVNV